MTKSFQAMASHGHPAHARGHTANHRGVWSLLTWGACCCRVLLRAADLVPVQCLHHVSVLSVEFGNLFSVVGQQLVAWLQRSQAVLYRGQRGQPRGNVPPLVRHRGLHQIGTLIPVSLKFQNVRERITQQIFKAAPPRSFLQTMMEEVQEGDGDQSFSDVPLSMSPVKVKHSPPPCSQAEIDGLNGCVCMACVNANRHPCES